MQGMSGVPTRRLGGAWACWRTYRTRLHEQLRRVFERQRQRAALGRLDERLLRDVGLTREQARREVAKPPWRD